MRPRATTRCTSRRTTSTSRKRCAGWTCTVTRWPAAAAISTSGAAGAMASWIPRRCVTRCATWRRPARKGATWTWLRWRACSRRNAPRTDGTSRGAVPASRARTSTPPAARSCGCADTPARGGCRRRRRRSTSRHGCRCWRWRRRHPSHWSTGCARRNRTCASIRRRCSGTAPTSTTRRCGFPGCMRGRRGRFPASRCRTESCAPIPKRCRWNCRSRRRCWRSPTPSARRSRSPGSAAASSRGAPTVCGTLAPTDCISTPANSRAMHARTWSGWATGIARSCLRRARWNAARPPTRNCSGPTAACPRR